MLIAEVFLFWYKSDTFTISKEKFTAHTCGQNSRQISDLLHIGNVGILLHSLVEVSTC